VSVDARRRQLLQLCSGARHATNHKPIAGSPVRAAGCSGPETRSRTGSSAANRSRAAAGSPASPVQRARHGQGGRIGRTQILFPCVKDSLQQVEGSRVAAAIAEVFCDTPHAAAVAGEDTRAYGSRIAQAGHIAGRFVSEGIAASIRSAAACRQPTATSSGIWSRVTP